MPTAPHFDPSEPQTVGEMPGVSLGPTTAAPAPSPSKNEIAFGPTLGYLAGFIAAAAIVGFFAERKIGRTPFVVAIGFIAGNAAIYAFGLPWLSYFLGSVGYPNDLAATFAAGLNPFIVGDAVKILLASALLPGAWSLVKRLKK